MKGPHRKNYSRYERHTLCRNTVLDSTFICNGGQPIGGNFGSSVYEWFDGRNEGRGETFVAILIEGDDGVRQTGREEECNYKR